MLKWDCPRYLDSIGNRKDQEWYVLMELSYRVTATFYCINDLVYDIEYKKPKDVIWPVFFACGEIG
jgi:hypothetical protein